MDLFTDVFTVPWIHFSPLKFFILPSWCLVIPLVWYPAILPLLLQLWGVSLKVQPKDKSIFGSVNFSMNNARLHKVGHCDLLIKDTCWCSMVCKAALASGVQNESIKIQTVGHGGLLTGFENKKMLWNKYYPESPFFDMWGDKIDVYKWLRQQSRNCFTFVCLPPSCCDISLLIFWL